MRPRTLKSPFPNVHEGSAHAHITCQRARWNVNRNDGALTADEADDTEKDTCPASSKLRQLYLYLLLFDAGRETRTAIRGKIKEWRARTGEKAHELVTAFQRGEHDEDVQGAA